MSKKTPITALPLLAALMVSGGSAWATGPQQSTMTYQGRLSESGSPVTGARDVRVDVCDAVTGGSCSVGNTHGVSVFSGVFRTTFTVPPGVIFSTSQKWAEIRVGPVGGGLTALSPREQLTAVPFADFSRRAGELSINPNGGGFVSAEDQGVSFGVGNQDHHSMWANGDFYFGGTIFGTPPAARLHVSSSGATSSSAVLLVSSGSAPGQELFVVKGDGRVGINTTAPQTYLHIVNPLAAGNPAVVISRHGTTGGGQGIHFKHSGGTQGAPTAGGNGDPVLFIVGAAHDGSSYRELSAIESTIDGPVSVGSVPGNLRFYTARAGVGGVQEKMRITSGGSVGIGGIIPSATLHVSSPAGAGSTTVLLVSSGTQPGAELLQVKADGMAIPKSLKVDGKLFAGGASQVNGNLTNCGGGGASVVGNDVAGRITIGTSPGITCTLTFTSPWPAAPVCFINRTTANADMAKVEATSSASVSFRGAASSLLNTDVLDYFCLGY